MTWIKPMEPVRRSVRGHAQSILAWRGKRREDCQDIVLQWHPHRGTYLILARKVGLATQLKRHYDRVKCAKATNVGLELHVEATARHDVVSQEDELWFKKSNGVRPWNSRKPARASIR